MKRDCPACTCAKRGLRRERPFLAELRKLIVLAATVFLGSLFAQNNPQPPQFPNVPLQIQPGGGPIVIGPGGAITVPGSEEVEPSASSLFDPAAGRVGRPVEYRVILTGAQRMLDLPEIPKVDGLELSPAGRSIGSQVLNGALVMSSTFRYNAVAARAGRFTVPAFDVVVGTKQVRVPPAVLTVTEPEPGEAVYQPTRVELELPKRDFFVGETIGGRLLIAETPDESPQFVAHVAKTSGSVVFRPSMRPKREQFSLDGKEAFGLSMPVQITPILEGNAELGCQVMVHIQKMDPTGRRAGFTMQTTLDSKPVPIHVLALPRAGRLPGFTGAIGKFTIAQPKLSASEVEAGEPVTMTVTLTGEGNLEGASAPELDTSGGWTAYKPTTEFQPDPDDPQSASGTKTFVYTLVPGREGLKATPPLPFSYFDPVQRAYVDITVPPLPINVKPSSVPAAAPAPADAPRIDAALPPEPPRSAEPSMTGLEEKSGRWVHSLAPALGRRWFVYAQVVPPLALLALWAWRRRKEYLAAHPEVIRRRRARLAARRALAIAKGAAKNGDREAFLRASVGALREAAAPLDTAQAASLTREEVLRLLADDRETSAVARKLMESADATSYSAKPCESIEPSALLHEVERAVEALSRRA